MKNDKIFLSKIVNFLSNDIIFCQMISKILKIIKEIIFFQVTSIDIILYEITSFDNN